MALPPTPPQVLQIPGPLPRKIHPNGRPGLEKGGAMSWGGAGPGSQNKSRKQKKPLHTHSTPRRADAAMFGTLGGGAPAGGPDAQAQARRRRAEKEFAYFSSRLPYARRAAGCADDLATAVSARAACRPHASAVCAGVLWARRPCRSPPALTAHVPGRCSPRCARLWRATGRWRRSSCPQRKPSPSPGSGCGNRARGSAAQGRLRAPCRQRGASASPPQQAAACAPRLHQAAQRAAKVGKERKSWDGRRAMRVPVAATGFLPAAAPRARGQGYGGLCWILGSHCTHVLLQRMLAGFP